MVSHHISVQQQHWHRPIPIRVDTSGTTARDVHESSEALELRILGVYTAASLNAVDCALVHYRQESPDSSPCLQVLQTAVIPIPTYITTQMFNVLRDTSKDASATTQFMIQLGQVHSAAIKSFCQRLNLDITFIDLIGSHSEAIEMLELPPRGEAVSPVSLATGIVIAAQTALTTVTDFGMEDQAQAEDSARRLIDERFDNLFLRHESKLRVCLDIGSTTTLALIAPSREIKPGPTIYKCCHQGTRPVDTAIHLFSKVRTLQDVQGTGQINHDIVDQYTQRSQDVISETSSGTGEDAHCEQLVRELLDECMFMAMPAHDTIATITRIATESILRRYRNFVTAHVPNNRKVDEVIICGRGARNPNIVAHIRRQLQDTSVLCLETLGIPSSVKDAVSCAYFASEGALHFDGISQASPAKINANKVHGSVAPGPKWKKTMQDIARFGQGRPIPTISAISFRKLS